MNEEIDELKQDIATLRALYSQADQLVSLIEAKIAELNEFYGIVDEVPN